MSTKVSESTGYVPNIQMSAFGYVMAAIIAIVILPVLPIIVLAWIFWRAFVAGDEVESRYETWRTDPDRLRPSAPEPETDDDAEDD
ncbi:DUF7535 family protein [Natrarchaeobius chitinivorans]|uniref:Uncharacterized protein n=1 Tax=Natrarchaeobius chitinivorans TaxID=1679083 RepID=A0A3N6MI90_NATCH|nr:hypothetical protein [Natrarchaeobius chitinivorans]RQG96670.1 hypothetical protein EA473_06070 [Natrarchaeobius chitinivorans]